MLKIKNIFEDFQYVVERKKPEKICFGMSGDRDTSIIPKKLNQVCPATYDLLNIFSCTFQQLNKVRSRKGVGGLANDAPRFKRKTLMQIPSPTRYDLRTKYVKKQYKFAIFGTNEKRTMKVGEIPGPGTYKIASKKCRRTKFAYNFGRPSMIPTVKVNCQSRFIDKCDRCGTICNGDYWERNHVNYLCHTCWADERYVHEMFTQKEIKQFKKIRTCEFKHNHDGTTAAVRLLSDSHIKKLERLENYLDLFISC